MPWSGAGTYSLPGAYTPEVNGTTIDAARYNGATGDIATGISACLAKNGENVPTANLPMGGYKHTGAAAASASGQYLIFGQNGTGLLQGLTIGANGNWTLAAPSSSNALTINGVIGGIPLVLNGGNAASSYAAFQAATVTFASWGDCGAVLGTGTGQFGLSGTTGLQLGVNGTSSVSIGGNRNVTINAPSSGVAFRISDSNTGRVTALLTQSTSDTNFSLAAYNGVSGTSSGTKVAYFGLHYEGTGPNAGFNFYRGAGQTDSYLSVLTNNTERIVVSNTGNVTVNAPSSGSHTINGLTDIVKTGGGTTLRLQSTTATGASLQIYDSGSGGTGLVLTSAGAGGQIETNGTARISINSAGNATINAATSGTTANIIGANGERALQLTGTTSAVYLSLVDGQAGTREWLASVGGSAAGEFTLRDSTAAADRFGVDTAGRVYGFAVHNNASSPTGTSRGYFASGTYTPTLTAVTNVTGGGSSASVAQWTRVGNVVTVSGRVTIQTPGTGATNWALALPIASNFTAVEQASGMGGRVAGIQVNVSISADATNDRVDMVAVVSSATTETYAYTYTYLVA